MSTSEITNSEDIIDSRDVIARIEELRDMLPAEAGDVMPGTWDEIEDIRAELEALEALAKQGEDYADDWLYGASLIRWSYFTEYAEGMVKDCEGLPRELPGYIVVDWEATAKNIKVDYTEIDFDGVSYFIR